MFLGLFFLFYHQVIVALSEKSRSHIPYRNSMMTSVLRDRQELQKFQCTHTLAVASQTNNILLIILFENMFWFTVLPGVLRDHTLLSSQQRHVSLRTCAKFCFQLCTVHLRQSFHKQITFYFNLFFCFVVICSLGGNCMTTMIATCSVEKKNLDVSYLSVSTNINIMYCS